MKKLAVLTLALCLLLSGCSVWMEGSYVSVTPHREENTSTSQDMISVSSYIELRDALLTIVEAGTENATIGVERFNQDALENSMAMAVRNVTSSSPIGAYAVESISYELGTSAGIPALAVSVTYLHDRTEIRSIQQVEGMEQAEEAVAGALDACEAGIVFLVDGYEKTDFVQWIQDYADLHPESVMEVPSVTVNIYPNQGVSRVVELKFTYQTNRESLRTMQGSVQTVFNSAKYYVSGSASDNEKYAQLFAFLTNRYAYKLETSITPSYSLLCHGVGDSRAIAICFAAMCRQVGLECMVVSGTRAGEPWFWNIICDEGVYYHVDLIPFNQTGGFRELADGDMDGYVWDYSAYPACGVTKEETEQTEEQAEPTGQPEEQAESMEQPTEPTEQPTEAIPSTEQPTEPVETEPQPLDTIPD